MTWKNIKNGPPENEQTVLVYVKRMINYEPRVYETVPMTTIYTDGKHSVEDSDYCDYWSCDDVIYNEELNENIVKEGWWEIPESIDEGMNEIYGDIIYWMSIPKLPIKISN